MILYGYSQQPMVLGDLSIEISMLQQPVVLGDYLWLQSGSGAYCFCVIPTSNQFFEHVVEISY